MNNVRGGWKIKNKLKKDKEDKKLKILNNALHIHNWKENCKITRGTNTGDKKKKNNALRGEKFEKKCKKTMRTRNWKILNNVLGGWKIEKKMKKRQGGQEIETFLNVKIIKNWKKDKEK